MTSQETREETSREPETPRRTVAVLITPSIADAAPPGVDAGEFLRAAAEDTYELAAALDFVSPVLVTSVPGMEEIVWPGTPVVEIPDLSGPALVRAAFEALSSVSETPPSAPAASPRGERAPSSAPGAPPYGERALPYGEQAVLLSGDAPDLPGLLVGKLFRRLGRARIAVCPAVGGGAVAIAAHLPYPAWAGVGFDDPDPVRALRASAPGPRTVATGPGWHRLRTPGDVARLDPGLEGWDNTRALLSA
ncbi:DUF2064 domain-containing protein [Streptosporangium sandarakinum]|uniref:DUF2064 domain-containing protein n=1 Tax=Streptosporangium sandarakinum TaxID=1260955 RepID=UPI003D90872F